MPRRDTASLKYPFAQYTVYQHRIGKGLAESEARREYTRIRAILNKRIARIQSNAEFAGLGIAGQFPQGLPPLAQISPQDLPYKLQQAAQALTSARGSLKGLKQQRAAAIKALREQGITTVTTKNYREFYQFMHEARDRAYDRLYGSDSVAQLYDDLVNAGVVNPLYVIDRDFEWYLENIDSTTPQRRTSTEPVTALQLRKELEGR